MMLVVACLHLAGFFDWITELVVTRLKPHHLLPTVIFLSGLVSAFFVNDIICLVMVPFVLKATRRMGVKPVPYLLAVATASNIGSTATITGNPQNILIGMIDSHCVDDSVGSDIMNAPTEVEPPEHDPIEEQTRQRNGIQMPIMLITPPPLPRPEAVKNQPGIRPEPMPPQVRQEKPDEKNEKAPVQSLEVRKMRA